MPPRIAGPARALVLLATLLALVLAMAPAHAGSGEQRAQRRLNQLGCSSGAADGRMDLQARSALIRFQAANGLNQSGNLTRGTRSKMFGKRQVRCDRRPVVRSGTGRRVVISQRQNYVWLVRADGSVAGQGGLVDNPRVLSPGTYSVRSLCGRSAKIRMNSDYGGRLWLPYFTRFAPCGVGFHQIPVQKSDGRQIHPDWKLGTDLETSSGCVRLSGRLARQLWGFAGVGTKVVVR